MARGTWADAVRVREGRRALERRRGDPFVRKEVQNDSASLYIPVTRNVKTGAPHGFASRLTHAVRRRRRA